MNRGGFGSVHEDGVDFAEHSPNEKPHDSGTFVFNLDEPLQKRPTQPALHHTHASHCFLQHGTPLVLAAEFPSVTVLWMTGHWCSMEVSNAVALGFGFQQGGDFKIALNQRGSSEP